MKDISDMTTDQKTKMNKFFEIYEKQYNETSFTQLKDIDTLFFLYDKEYDIFVSFGRDLNETIKNALKWNAPKTEIAGNKIDLDVNYLLEYLNINYEFYVIALQYKPRLY